MRRCPLVFFAFLVLGMAGDHALSAQNPNDNCGPRYRRDPVATNRAREAKKAEMRQRGFPERFLSLLDREECVACVETASDSFGIKVVYNDDDNAPKDANGRRWTSHTFGWDPQSERQLRDDLAAGKIKAFYIMNTLTRCQCCPDVNDDSKTNASYADWNAELEMHMSHVIAFDDPGDLGPLPADLENPPDGWINDVPNVQQFRKPPHRQVHVLCKECAGLADKANSAYDTLNYLWDRKLSLLKGISITENAMGHRANQIARLEYQQLFSTASAARQKEIDTLKQVNKDQQEGVDREQRQLAEVDAQIAEQNQRIADLLKLIIDCENRCKTAVTTPAGTAVAATPPVTARPADQGTPGGAGTGQAPPAACPDCQAAAGEVARLSAAIEDRTAALNRVREAQRVNTANLANLAALRADAAGRADAAARVAELESRIAELQAANRGLRAEAFKLQEEIQALAEALDKARRDLDACNRRCSTAAAPTATDLGLMPGRGERKVVVNPSTPAAACAACEGLAKQLVDAHRTLEELAQRANDRQVESDFEDFEEQRVKVADLEKQLAACNQKCTTSASAGPGTTGSSGASPGGIAPPGALAVAPALCPDCQAAAAELARLAGDIERRTAALNDLGRTRSGNDSNLANLMAMRARADGQPGSTARVAELETRIAELQAANRDIRAQEFKVQEEIQELTEAVAKARRDLDACNRRCSTATGAVSTGPGLTTGRGQRTVVVSPIAPVAACAACEGLVKQLRDAHRTLEDLAQRANDRQIESDFEDFEEQRVKVAELEKQLAACNQKCSTTVAAAPEPEPAVCFGSECADQWKSCAETGTCPPVETDCGVPGACDYTGPPDAAVPYLDLADPAAWGPAADVDVEVRLQEKIVDIVAPPPCSSSSPSSEVFCGKVQFNRDNSSPAAVWRGYGFDTPRVWIPPTARQKVQQWFNPIGLLARRLLDHVERWRGSMGPRPLLTKRDLDHIDRVSGAQAAGLPRGLHVLLTDQGGSTGKTLTMQVLNFTGREVALSSRSFVVQPIRQQAQQRVQQAFNRLAQAGPARFDLSAYCLEFAKAPPSSSTLLRLAPANVQQKYGSMTKVLRSAYRVQEAGLLRPDSNPAAYTDSIKQWAVWTVEQRFNQSRYTDAFIAHTKKNVEAAGQSWTRQAEDVIRKVSPNRWQDIVKVLTGAGLPPSQ